MMFVIQKTLLCACYGDLQVDDRGAESCDRHDALYVFRLFGGN